MPEEDDLPKVCGTPPRYPVDAFAMNLAARAPSAGDQGRLHLCGGPAVMRHAKSTPDAEAEGLLEPRGGRSSRGRNDPCRLVRSSLGRVDGEVTGSRSGLAHPSNELSQPGNIEELSMSSPRLVAQSSFEQVERSGHAYEECYAAGGLDDLRRLLGEGLESLPPAGPTPRRAVGKDEAHTRPHGSAEHVESYPVEHLHEWRAPEFEDLAYCVDGEVVVEETKAGEVSQLLSDRQLSRRRRSIEVHEQRNTL